MGTSVLPQQQDPLIAEFEAKRAKAPAVPAAPDTGVDPFIAEFESKKRVGSVSLATAPVRIDQDIAPQDATEMATELPKLRSLRRPPAAPVDVSAAPKPADPDAGLTTEQVLEKHLREHFAPTNEAAIQASIVPKSLPGRTLYAAGSMVAHPVQTVAGIALAAPKAGFTLGKFARQQYERSQAVRPIGQDATGRLATGELAPGIVEPGEDAVDPKEAAFAAGQLLVPALIGKVAPYLNSVFGEQTGKAVAEAVKEGKSPTEALLVGFGKRAAVGAGAGAAVGSVYSEDDPAMGALLGAALGGAHAATQAEGVRVPVPVADEAHRMGTAPKPPKPPVPAQARLATPSATESAPSVIESIDETLKKQAADVAAKAEEEHMPHWDVETMGPKPTIAEHDAFKQRAVETLMAHRKGTPPAPEPEQTGIITPEQIEARDKPAGAAPPEPGPRKFAATALTVTDYAKEKGIPIEEAATKLRAADYDVTDDVIRAAGGDPSKITTVSWPGHEATAAAVAGPAADLAPHEVQTISNVHDLDDLAKKVAADRSIDEDTARRTIVGRIRDLQTGGMSADKSRETVEQEFAPPKAAATIEHAQAAQPTGEEPVRREEGTGTPGEREPGRLRPAAVQADAGAEAKPGVEVEAAAAGEDTDRAKLEKRPTVAGAEGKASETFLSSGQKVATKYRVIEADDLQPSHNPETFAANPVYPAGVQGREYAGKRGEAARSQVMTGALRPEVVLDRGSGTTDGPPLITHHGIVVAGNDRSMRLLRASKMSPDQYFDYRKELLARAGDFGVDKTQIEGMKNPVLVRQIDDKSVDVNDPAALGALNRESDTAPTKTKDQITAAMSRAKAMQGAHAALQHLADTMDPSSTVRHYLGTSEGRDFVRELVSDGVIASQELPAFVDKATNVIHSEGKQKLEDMLYAAAIGDADVMSRAPDSVLKKIGPAVPAIVASNQVPGYDLSKVLQGALDIHASAAAMRAEAGSGKRSIADFLGQGDMFGRQHDPEAAALALYLESHKASEVSKALREYAKLATHAQREAGGGGELFGYTPEKPESARERLFTADEKKGVAEGAPDYKARIAAIDRLAQAHVDALSKGQGAQLASMDEINKLSPEEKRAVKGRIQLLLRGGGIREPSPSFASEQGDLFNKQSDLFDKALDDPTGPEARALDRSEAAKAYGSVEVRRAVADEMAPLFARIKAAGLQTTAERKGQVAAASDVQLIVKGTDVSNPEALLAAAAVVRHPQAEHLSYVIRDRDTGEALEHSISTSGMLNFANVDWKQMAKQIAERIESHGGPEKAEAVLIHNHPSGSTESSSPDRMGTFKLDRLLGNEGIKLAGHLITDHDTGNWLSVGDDGLEEKPISVPGANTGATWTPIAKGGQKENVTASMLAAAVRDAVGPKGVTVFHLDLARQIIAAHPVAPGIGINELAKQFMADRASLGSREVVVAVPGADARTFALAARNARLTEDAWGHYVLDVLRVTPSTTETPDVVSLVNELEYPGPDDDWKSKFERKQPLGAGLANRRGAPGTGIAPDLHDDGRSAALPGQVAEPPDLFGDETPEEKKARLNKPIDYTKAISAEEMAQRSARGETNSAVENITGEEPLATSKDEAQIPLLEKAPKYGQPALTSDALFRRSREIEKRLGLQRFDTLLDERTGDIVLAVMVTPKEMRGQGKGSAAVQELTDLADQYGRRIRVNPAGRGDLDEGTSGKRRLAKFYQRFGFRKNTGKTADLSVSDAMIREPVTAPRLEHEADAMFKRGRAEAAEWKELMPNAEDYDDGLGICTRCAEKIVSKFGGAVIGYENENNPTAKLDNVDFGHDFAITGGGRYLVDPWAKNTTGETKKATLDLNDPTDRAEALRLYGDPDKWEVTDDAVKGRELLDSVREKLSGDAAIEGPIRTGDQLKDPRGTVWAVIETRPGGHVDLFNKERSRFATHYTRQLRGGGWTRIANQDDVVREPPPSYGAPTPPAGTPPTPPSPPAQPSGMKRLRAALSEAVTDPTARIRDEHPALSQAISSANAMSPNEAGVFARHLGERVLAGLSTEQQQQFGRRLTLDNVDAAIKQNAMAAIDKRVRAAALDAKGKTLPKAQAEQYFLHAVRLRAEADDHDETVRRLTKEADKIRPLVPSAIEKAPWFQKALQRHKDLVQPFGEEAAAKAGVNPASFRQPPLGAYQRLIPADRLSEPLIKRAQSIAANEPGATTPRKGLTRALIGQKRSVLSSSPTGTEEPKQGPVDTQREEPAPPVASNIGAKQSGSAHKVTGGRNYSTDYLDNVAYDASDKVSKAAANSVFEAVAQDAAAGKDGMYELAADKNAPPGMRVVAFNDSKQLIDPPPSSPDMNARIRRFAVPPAVADVLDRYRAPQPVQGVAARTLSRGLGGVTRAVLTNPIIAGTHTMTIASSVGTGIPAKSKTLGLTTALPGVKVGSTLVRMKGVDFDDPQTSARLRRLAFNGTLRSAAGKGGGIVNVGHQFLFGASGADTRGRVIASEDVEAALRKAGITPDDPRFAGLERKYVLEHVGNYVSGNQGTAVKWLQDSGIAPFIAINRAKLGVSLKSLVGADGTIDPSAGRRLGIGLRGIIGTAAALAAASWMLSGHTPDENAPGHEGDMATGVYHLPDGSYRYFRGAPADAMAQFGKGSKEVYLRRGFVDQSSESSLRVLQQLVTANRGDKIHDVLRAAVNTGLGFVGPGPGMMFGLATGKSMYLDPDGNFASTDTPQLPGARDLGLRDRLTAAVRNANAGAALAIPPVAGQPAVSLGRPLVNILTEGNPLGRDGAQQREFHAWEQGKMDAIYRAKTPEARQEIVAAALREAEAEGFAGPFLYRDLTKAMNHAGVDRSAASKTRFLNRYKGARPDTSR